MNNKLVETFVHDVYRGNPRQYVKYRQAGGNPEDALKPLMNSVFTSLSPDRFEVLDLGCGYGSSLPKVEFSRYVGVDLSPYLLKLHPFKGRPGVSLIAGDVRSLNYERYHYNLVLGILVLNYIKDPEQLLKRVRRQNVNFCFVIPNPQFDELFAIIYSDGTLVLDLQGLTFAYYHHSLEHIIESVSSVSSCHVVFSDPPSEKAPSVYTCLHGQW